MTIAGCAAVLPSIAASELLPTHYLQYAVPELAPLTSRLLLAWRRRLGDSRPRVTALRRHLAQRLRQLLT